MVELNIELTVGEIRLAKERKMFNSIVLVLALELSQHTDPDGEIQEDIFNEITAEAAKDLGSLFGVDADTFFKAEWSIIEWHTNLYSSYYYAQGMVSIIKMS